MAAGPWPMTATWWAALTASSWVIVLSFSWVRWCGGDQKQVDRLVCKGNHCGLMIKVLLRFTFNTFRSPVMEMGLLHWFRLSGICSVRHSDYGRGAR